MFRLLRRFLLNPFIFTFYMGFPSGEVGNLSVFCYLPFDFTQKLLF